MNCRKNAQLVITKDPCKRTQQVKIHDELSDSILLESGVVQGSVLGPVLYNVYSRSTKKTFAESGFETLKIFF